MPHFHISTNVSKSEIPSNFLKETSALIAKILGKPESVSIRVLFFESSFPNIDSAFFSSIVL